MRARLTALVLILAVAMSPLALTTSEAFIPSIGMSGSFYSYDNIILTPGGSLNSSEAYIVVYNYGDSPLQVRLRYSAPPGFTVQFIGWGDNPRTLSPGEHVRVQVVVVVNESVLPGRYRVGVYADAVLNSTRGVVVVPGAGQEITVNVIGEYSILNVYALDPAGNPASEAIVRVYGIVAGRLKAIVEGRGEIHAKLVPGNYEVVAYLSGEEAARENVSLKPFEEKTLNLTLKVLYFELFSVNPITDQKGRLLAVRLHIVLKNLYKTINDARMILYVYRDGSLVEERTIQEASILPKGRVEHYLDYVPVTGWKSGNYTLIVRVYGLGGVLLAESKPVWLYYKAPLNLLWLALIALAIVGGVVVFSFRRSRRGRGGRPNAS